MKKLLLLSFTVFSLLYSVSSDAQVLLSGGSSYSQNFDSLASTGTSAFWTDNSTLTGWYAQYAVGTLTNYNISTGSGTAGGIYSYGSASASDRALGSLPVNAEGAAGSPAIAYGLRVQNNTANAFSQITISYTGEQWRVANTVVESLNFSYIISSSAITSPSVSTATGWTAVSALNFSSPINTGTGALNGNLAANQTALSAVISGINLAPGDEIFFRWVDVNDSGNDDGLAIDNFSLAAVPEPSSFALATLGGIACFFAARRKR